MGCNPVGVETRRAFDVVVDGVFDVVVDGAVGVVGCVDFITFDIDTITIFDSIAPFINNEDDSLQVEIWFARELQTLLGYARWENFIVAVHRAVDSCKTLNINVNDHFREVTKMIEIGKGGCMNIVY